MTSSTHRHVRSDNPCVQEPYFLPGYTGYCPYARWIFGKTYGQMTHEIITKDLVIGGRLSDLPGEDDSDFDLWKYGRSWYQQLERMRSVPFENFLHLARSKWAEDMGFRCENGIYTTDGNKYNPGKSPFYEGYGGWRKQNEYSDIPPHTFGLYGDPRSGTLDDPSLLGYPFAEMNSFPPSATGFDPAVRLSPWKQAPNWIPKYELEGHRRPLERGPAFPRGRALSGERYSTRYLDGRPPQLRRSRSFDNMADELWEKNSGQPHTRRTDYVSLRKDWDWYTGRRLGSPAPCSKRADEYSGRLRNAPEVVRELERLTLNEAATKDGSNVNCKDGPLLRIRPSQRTPSGQIVAPRISSEQGWCAASSYARRQTGRYG